MNKLAALLLLTVFGSARADDGWRVRLERDGIVVASRHVAFSPIDEIRAVATFELPAQTILSVLADVDHYPINLPPTQLVRRIGGAGDDAYYYVEVKPPMVTRRYYCMHSNIRHLADGVLRAEFSSGSDGCPARPGMVRLDDNAGSWTLTPLAADRTRVIYQAHTNPAGAVPVSLVNWVHPRAIADLVASLRKASMRSQLTATSN